MNTNELTAAPRRFGKLAEQAAELEALALRLAQEKQTVSMLDTPEPEAKPNRQERRQGIKRMSRVHRTPYLQILREARAIQARFNPPLMVTVKTRSAA